MALSSDVNVEGLKGNLRRIADLHIIFYKFYIEFATNCEAVAFDRKGQDYLESCLDYLKYKELTVKVIQQSCNNMHAMIEAISDLLVSVGGEKSTISTLSQLITEASVDGDGDVLKEDKGAALDLLKHLKTLLSDPIEVGNPPKTQEVMEKPTVDEGGRASPSSVGSHSPEHPSRSRGGIEPMTQYLLSDLGMDYTLDEYNNNCKIVTMTYEMNNIASQAGLLRENMYAQLDNMIAKTKINVPIWNYNIDRVDAINSNNVIENMEVFEGNKSVKEAVLNGSPDHFSVGPFEVYHRNKVFVYLCYVNGCERCHTMSLEYLKTHVKFSHGESEIDWDCTACELINMHSVSQKSLDGALDHLAKYHSMKTTYALSKERLMEMNRIISLDNLESNSCPVVKSDVPIEDKLDLFLCPNPGCQFSTNSVTDAFGHFSALTNISTFFNCCFCNYVSYSPYAYCGHLVQEHGNAKFRCGYCLYRSVSKANCVHHVRDTHPGLPSKIFGLEPLNEAVYNYNCRAHNSLYPFKCNEPCNFSSMIEQKFNGHLLNHQGLAVQCAYCSQFENDDISELRDHMLLHGVGEYLCLYCNEAFNFISKIERHLHERHSSQYPFMLICQDFDSRSHSLKGKYVKLQKFDLGEESIIVLPLETDKSISSVEVFSATETILIEDVDHCKLQLKHFMRNTFEPLPQVVESAKSPNIIDTIDITEGEERTDVKPRLRIRNIEELLKSQSSGEPSTSSSKLASPETPSDVTANEPDLPHSTNEPELPLLITPLNIKSEFHKGDPPQKEAPQSELPSPISIKKEAESPKKRRQPNSLSVKAVNIKQEKTSDVSVVDDINDLPIIQSVQSLEGLEESARAAAALIQEAMQDMETEDAPVPVNEIVINSDTQQLNVTLLSEADLENMPVDFDCDVMPNSLAQDEDKSVPPQVRYQDPADDTVVISDGEEYDDTPPQTVGLVDSSTLPLNQYGSDVASNSVRISGTTSLVVNTPVSSGSTFMLLNTNPTNAPSTSRVDIVRPTITLKKYRCTICDFTSEDRKTTEDHLRAQHSDIVSNTQKPKTSIQGDVFVAGISCPYCSDKVYEGVKGFERHHRLEHGIFSEIKCFFIFPPGASHPDRLFACTFCGSFCKNEESVWKHTWQYHMNKMNPAKKPIRLKSLVALKKMVCPLYDCLEEFLQPAVFIMHLKAHGTVIACKTCTYIADSVEGFQQFHNAIDPVERLTHFYYKKTKQEIMDLYNVKRFSNPLYSLNEVVLDDGEYYSTQPAAARKSTGPQYL